MPNTDPEVDNSVKPTESETTPPEVTETKDNVEELKTQMTAQATRHSQQMAGSKAEVMNMKAEIQALKDSVQKPQEESPQVNEDDIALFNAYAEKAGYVKKTDLEQFRSEQGKNVQNDAVEKFLEQYPEYKPENDTDNSKWEVLINEYSLFKAPKTPNPKSYLALLKKAHKTIAPDNSLKKGEALGMAKANLNEQAKLGGSGGGSTEKAAKTSPEQQAIKEEFKKVRPEYFS